MRIVTTQHWELFVNTMCWWNKAAEGCLDWVLDPPFSMWQWLRWYSEAFQPPDCKSVHSHMEKGGSKTQPRFPSVALFQHIVLKMHPEFLKTVWVKSLWPKCSSGGGLRKVVFSPLCYILVDNFITRLSFKNLNVVFLSIDAKCVLKFEKCPLVAKLKLKILQMADFSHFQFQLCHQRALSKC